MNKSENKKLKKDDDLLRDIRKNGIPLISIIATIAIGIFLIKPNIDTLSPNIQKKKNMELSLQELKFELKDLEEVERSRELDDDLLNQLDILIPTKKTKVVEFDTKIKELGVQAGVKMDEETEAGETISNKDEEDQLTLVQLPVTFSMVGNFENLRNMLSLIYNSDDFIVISEMSLTNQEEEAKMELVLSKYQYLPIESTDILSTVSYKETISKEVQDYIERKMSIE